MSLKFQKGRKKIYTSLCMTILCVQMMSIQEVYSQSKTDSNIKIQLNEASILEVFEVIKKQLPYTFLYSDQVVALPKKSNISKDFKTIQEALDYVAKHYGIEYQILNNTISVKVKKDKKQKITGVIKDATGFTIPGATVMIKGSYEGVSSDLDGSFELLVNQGVDVLQISFLGYEVLETLAENQKTYILKEEKQSLEEIVVVGYAKQKKVNLTGSVSVVDGKEMEGRPITNSSQALQGVSGLYVSQAGGQPGADAASIRIRGLGTVGSGSKLDPLVLVDGVEYSLNDVNPNDIESISVLKDAASSSIYGSRATNGVILITTKNGRKGDMRVEYSNYFGFQEATYLPDVVDSSVDFMEMYNRAMVNQGGLPYYSDDLIQEFRDNPTSQQYPNTNWMKEMFKSAPIQEHNLRLSGGSENSIYSMSLGYLNQEGVLKDMSAAERFSLNLKVNSKISEHLNFDAGIMATRWDIDEPTQGISTVMNRLMRMVPMQPVGRLENGNWPDSWVLTPGQNSFENPLIFANEGYRNQVKDRIMANVSFDLKLVEGLHYIVKGSANQFYGRLKNWRPEVSLYNVFTGEKTRDWSSYSVKEQRNDQDLRLNATQLVTFDKDLTDNHTISVLLGSSVETFKGDFNSGSIRGFPTMDLTELNIGTHTPSVNGTSYEDALVSYFGRFQYSYNDKYLVEVNSRYDGSSRFKKGSRWGFFPSLSGGWRISQENFMNDILWVDEMKLRVSWGKIGNQEIGRFQYLNAVDLGKGYAFGGDYVGGSAVTQFRDPQISWETTTMSNVGLDFGLFKGSLVGSFEWFNKKTDDILRTVALPGQVGALAGPVKNIAKVENKGLELGLNYQGNITSDLSYSVGGSITKIKNTVVDLAGETMISGGRITEEGMPINSWYVYKTDGLFQTQEEIDNYPTVSNRVSPGDVKYVDLNNDGTINGDDRYVAGNTYPEYTYSFNLGFNYKGFSLSTFWQGIKGVDVYLDGNMAMPFNNGAGLTKDWLTDSWTPENRNAPLPKITSKSQYIAENFSQSDYWLRDASYLRLKNIQIAYDFNAKTLERIGVTKLRMFINGQNLLTFSKLNLFDPEKNVSQNDIGEYPSVKIMTMGINIEF